MEWWMLEWIKIAALAVMAVGIHQFIRRFGKSYVTDIFRATPSIGRNFLILADVSYYLIFAAYVLFNVNFSLPQGWEAQVGSAQIEAFVMSIAGLGLIMGIMHGLNVFILPFIGGVLALRELTVKWVPAGDVE